MYELEEVRNKRNMSGFATAKAKSERGKALAPA